VTTGLKRGIAEALCVPAVLALLSLQVYATILLWWRYVPFSALFPRQGTSGFMSLLLTEDTYRLAYRDKLIG
jgi:hypothetical protein